jgi:hypothetical protein
MKITKRQLQQIIKEEIKNFLKEKEEIKTEGSGPGGWGPDDAKKPGESLSDYCNRMSSDEYEYHQCMNFRE